MLVVQVRVVRMTVYQPLVPVHVDMRLAGRIVRPVRVLVVLVMLHRVRCAELGGQVVVAAPGQQAPTMAMRAPAHALGRALPGQQDGPARMRKAPSTSWRLVCSRPIAMLRQTLWQRRHSSMQARISGERCCMGHLRSGRRHEGRATEETPRLPCSWMAAAPVQAPPSGRSRAERPGDSGQATGRRRCRARIDARDRWCREGHESRHGSWG
jgi:hypothetical protein